MSVVELGERSRELCILQKAEAVDNYSTEHLEMRED